MKDQFLLLNMKIKNESKYILFFKRAFSGVLEGVTSKIFLGTSPQTLCMEKFHIFIFNMHGKRQTLCDSFAHINNIERLSAFQYTLQAESLPILANFDRFHKRFSLGCFCFDQKDIKRNGNATGMEKISSFNKGSINVWKHY